MQASGVRLPPGAAGAVAVRHGTGLGGQETPAAFPALPFLCSVTLEQGAAPPQAFSSPIYPSHCFFVWVGWVELLIIQSRDSFDTYIRVCIYIYIKCVASTSVVEYGRK